MRNETSSEWENLADCEEYGIIVIKQASSGKDSPCVIKNTVFSNRPQAQVADEALAVLERAQALQVRLCLGVQES